MHSQRVILGLFATGVHCMTVRKKSAERWKSMATVGN
jgi:hypothetical protein